MGSRFAAGKRGRYEEKGGGREVGSFFEESTENEKIKAVYGNYGLWAWVRYWWIDTENFVLMLLSDRSYHDYDYTEPAAKPRKLTAQEREPLSRSKLAKLFGRLVVNQATGETLAEAQLSKEERVQRELRRDLGIF